MSERCLVVRIKSGVCNGDDIRNYLIKLNLSPTHISYRDFVFIVTLGTPEDCQKLMEIGILRLKSEEGRDAELQIEHVDKELLEELKLEPNESYNSLALLEFKSFDSEPNSFFLVEDQINKDNLKHATIENSNIKTEEASQSPEVQDLMKKTIKVANVSGHYNDLRNFVAMEKKGGGDLESEYYSPEDKIAYFVFEKPEVAANLLSKGKCKIMNCTFIFEPPEIMEYISINDLKIKDSKQTNNSKVATNSKKRLSKDEDGDYKDDHDDNIDDYGDKNVVDENKEYPHVTDNKTDEIKYVDNKTEHQQKISSSKPKHSKKKKRKQSFLPNTSDETNRIKLHKEDDDKDDDKDDNKDDNKDDGTSNGLSNSSQVCDERISSSNAKVETINPQHVANPFKTFAEIQKNNFTFNFMKHDPEKSEGFLDEQTASRKKIEDPQDVKASRDFVAMETRGGGDSWSENKPQSSGNLKDKSIVVYGIADEDLVEDVVLPHLEHKRRGGGTIAWWKFEQRFKKLNVTFEEIKVAQNFVEKKILKIQGKEMFTLSMEKELQLERMIIITEVNSVDEAENLICFMESTKKGGGKMEFEEFRGQVNELLVRFVDKQVAEKFKKMKTWRVVGKTFTFHEAPFHYQLDLDWSSRTVFFGGVSVEIHDDLLIYLENEKFGGPIVYSKHHPHLNLEVIFFSQSVTKLILDLKFMTLWGERFIISKSLGNFIEDSEKTSDSQSDNLYDSFKSVAESPSCIANCSYEKDSSLLSREVSVENRNEIDDLRNKVLKDDDNDDDDDDDGDSDDVRSLTRNMKRVILSDISPDISEELLKLYLGNVKKCGKCVMQYFDGKQRQAVVEFENAQGAIKFVERNHDIPMVTHLSEVNPSGFESQAILIKNAKEFGKELIILYFENKSRSGGGPVLECDYRDENSVYVVFANVEDARSAMTTENHELCGKVMNVAAIKTQPPPVHVPNESADDKRLLVNNLQSKIDGVYFTELMEKVAKSKVEELIRGKNSAILVFCSSPDYFSLRKHTSCYPVKGYMVCLQRLRRANQIQAALPLDVNFNSVKNYFDLLTPSDDKVDFQLNEDNGLITMTYRKHETVRRILSSDIIIDGLEIEAKPYFEEFQFDTVKPVVPIRRKFFYDVEVLQFVVNHSNIKTEIETSLFKTFPNVAVIWSESDSEIILTLTSNNSDVAYDWWKLVEAELKQLLKAFHWKEKNFLHDIWQEATNLVKQNQEWSTNNNLIVKFDEENSTISFNGGISDCKNFSDFIDKTIKIILSKKEKVCETNHFNPKQISLITKLMNVIEKSNEVEINVSDDILKLEGPSELVNNLKLEILKRVNNFVTEELELEQNIQNFLGSKSFMEYFNDVMINKGILASVVVDSAGMVAIIGDGESSLVEAKKLIMSNIKQDELKLKPNQLEIINLDIWPIFVSELQKKLLNFVLCYKEGVLSYVCLDYIEKKLVESVMDFIEENCIGEKFFKVEDGFREAMSRFCKEELKDIEEILKKQGGSMKQVTDQNKGTGFLLLGKQANLESNGNKLNEVKNRIKQEKVILRNPDITGYFNLKETINLIKTLEESYSVLVKTSTKEIEKEEEKEDENQSESDPVGLHSEQFELIEMEHVQKDLTFSTSIVKDRIVVVKDSIVNVKADVLVNSSGLDLNLSRGQASQCLLAAAGNEIQAACTKNKPSNFSIGDIVSTKGYQLNCQRVYHVSCGEWKGKQCGTFVRTIVKNVLTKASKKSFQSVAFAALGTGNLRAPPTYVADIMFSESVSFFLNNKNTSIKKIYFVVYDKDLPTIKAFEDCYTSYASQEFFDMAGSSISKDGVHDDDEDEDVESLGDQDSAGPISSPAIDVSNPLKLTLGALEVEVVKGDITSFGSDAIVNSTNKNMNLGGAVAKAILKKGGENLLDEFKSVKMKPTGVCVTKAGNLPCNFIVHVVAQNNMDGWKSIIYNALVEADAYGCNSIAFPVLGSGNLNKPADEMAPVMIQTFQKYSLSSDLKHLRKIYICIYLQDIMKGFVNGIKNMESNKSEGFISKAMGSLKILKDTVVNLIGQKEIDKKDELKNPSNGFDHSVVVLEVYGTSSNDIRAVIDLIQSDSRNHFCEKVLESDRDKHLIGKLRPPQILQLNILKEKFKVDIKVNTDENSRNIKIFGTTENCSRTIQAVMVILQQVEHDEKEMAAAEVLMEKVSWEFMDADNNFKPYNPRLNYLLEEMYSGSRKLCSWKEDKNEFKVNFKNMIVTCNGSVEIKIRRTDTELPKIWSRVPDNVKYLTVLLSPSDKEFIEVEQNARATAGNTIKTIHKIERVQNPTMYKSYQVRKAAMENSLSGKQVELTLWHGTSGNVLHEINKAGFNRSYCGKNATIYGRGVYFAKNFCYSAHNTYSPPDASGVKYVYQSKVLVGEFTVGTQSYITPPQKPNSQDNYDSVVDNVASPGIFVVFYDFQAYPEYLIHFS